MCTEQIQAPMVLLHEHIYEISSASSSLIVSTTTLFRIRLFLLAVYLNFIHFICVFFNMFFSAWDTDIKGWHNRVLEQPYTYLRVAFIMKLESNVINWFKFWNWKCKKKSNYIHNSESCRCSPNGKNTHTYVFYTNTYAVSYKNQIWLGFFFYIAHIITYHLFTFVRINMNITFLLFFTYFFYLSGWKCVCVCQEKENC